MDLSEEQLEILADKLHSKLIQHPPPQVMTRWPFENISKEQLQASVEFYLEMRDTLKSTRKTVFTAGVIGLFSLLGLLIFLGTVQKIKEALGSP